MASPGGNYKSVAVFCFVFSWEWDGKVWDGFEQGGDKIRLPFSTGPTTLAAKAENRWVACGQRWEQRGW